MIEQWNMWLYNNATYVVELQNFRWLKSERSDDGTVEQSWWNRKTLDGGTEKHLMVEQWIISWLNNGTYVGGTVEQRWLNS